MKPNSRATFWNMFRLFVNNNVYLMPRWEVPTAGTAANHSSADIQELLDLGLAVVKQKPDGMYVLLPNTENKAIIVLMVIYQDKGISYQDLKKIVGKMNINDCELDDALTSLLKLGLISASPDRAEVDIKTLYFLIPE
jgi:DNA-binding MarR family transcriptional regulator